MKTITVYEAADGSRWDDEKDARARDELIEEAARFLVSIGVRERPDASSFWNGEGYIQQPRGARDSIVGWAKRHGWTRDTDGPVGDLAYRAQCMDARDREWGQPYFALNPEQGVEFEIPADDPANAGPSSEEPGEAEAP